MSTWRYLGPPGIERDILPKGSEFPWNDWFGGMDTGFTASCRAAIATGCPMLDIRAGDEILVPDYHCGSELDVLLLLGLQPRIFHVDDALEPSWDQMQDLVNERTKAVYLIGYFGSRQDPSRARTFCDKNGLFLIEDAALTFLSKREPGNEPDILVASLPKFLGFNSGGLLAYQKERHTLPTTKLASSGVFKERFKLSRRTLLRRISDIRGLNGLVGKLLEPRSPLPLTEPNEVERMPASYFSDARLLDNLGCPDWIQRSCLRLDIEKIRSNFAKVTHQVLQQSPWSTNWNLISPAPSDQCLSPVIALEAPDPSEVIRAAGLLGPICSRWWSGRHPKLVQHEGPAATRLRDRVLAIRVHHQMSRLDLDYLIERMHTAMG